MQSTEASPEVRDAAGRADPGAGHHHHAPTFLLPEQLGHVLQGELLLPLVTSPRAQNGSGSRAQTEGPGALGPARHRGKHSAERTDGGFGSGGENHPKIPQEAVPWAGLCWGFTRRELGRYPAQTPEQTRPSALPFMDLKYQTTCVPVRGLFLDGGGHGAGATGNHQSQC